MFRLCRTRLTVGGQLFKYEYINSVLIGNINEFSFTQYIYYHEILRTYRPSMQQSIKQLVKKRRQQDG